MRNPKVELRLSDQGMILVTVSLCFELFFIGVLFITLEEAQQTLRQSEYSRTIIRTVKQSADTIGDAVKLALTQPEHAKQASKFYKISQTRHLAQLQSLVAGNAEESKAVSKLQGLLNETLSEFQAFEGMSLEQMSLFMLNGGMTNLAQIARNVSVEIAKIVDSEDKKTRELDRKELVLQNRVSTILLAGVPTSILLAYSLLMIFNRYTDKRLNILMQNITRFSHREPLLEPLGGADELTELDRTFRQMADSLTSKETSKQKLLAVITDNLHKPLTSLTWCLDTISSTSGELPEKATKDIQVALCSVDRLTSLVESLLDVKTLGAGRLELKQRILSVRRIAERAVSSILAWAEHRNVDIQIEIDDQLTCTADGDRLEQVLVNLVSNALKFSPTGGNISVSAQSDQNWIEVRITDCGPGIPSEEKARIFERFEQIDGSSTVGRSGSGLGLHICKTIITAHGGSIGVDSVVGSGSTFWFRIPKEPINES